MVALDLLRTGKDSEAADEIRHTTLGKGTRWVRGWTRATVSFYSEWSPLSYNCYYYMPVLTFKAEDKDFMCGVMVIEYRVLPIIIIGRLGSKKDIQSLPSLCKMTNII